MVWILSTSLFPGKTLGKNRSEIFGFGNYKYKPLSKLGTPGLNLRNLTGLKNSFESIQSELIFPCGLDDVTVPVKRKSGVMFFLEV